jgi:hypothetical protein
LEENGNSGNISEYKLGSKDFKKTEREAIFIISKITEDIKE